MIAPGNVILTSLSFYALVVTLGCSSGIPAVKQVHFKDAARVIDFKKLPFHRAWYDPGVNWEGFKGIYVTPVNCDSLKE